MPRIVHQQSRVDGLEGKLLARPVQAKSGRSLSAARVFHLELVVPFGKFHASRRRVTQTARPFHQHHHAIDHQPRMPHTVETKPELPPQTSLEKAAPADAELTGRQQGARQVSLGHVNRRHPIHPPVIHVCPADVGPQSGHQPRPQCRPSIPVQSPRPLTKRNRHPTKNDGPNQQRSMKQLPQHIILQVSQSPSLPVSQPPSLPVSCLLVSLSPCLPAPPHSPIPFTVQYTVSRIGVPSAARMRNSIASGSSTR